jgi:tetratricopeptide (TPR) repeat protein
MGNPSISANPAASFLLNLALRRADGAVSLGARRVRLRGGRVAGIDPATGDESFEGFLVRSGRISQPDLAELSRSVQGSTSLLQTHLVQSGLLTQQAVREIQRSLWLDRLVRALRDVEGLERAAPILEPDRPIDDDGALVSTLYLVLDALARIAAEGPATQIGGAREARIDWVAGPHLEHAQQWADLGELADRPTIAKVLSRAPAAAAHIAALALAGLVRLIAPGERSEPPVSRVGTLPPPPPRAFVLASERPPSLHAVSRDPLQDVAAHVLPRLRLDPGADGESVQALPEVELRFFEQPGRSHGDPLVELERRITELEAQSASGQERAAAWRSLGVLWRDKLGALDEAARAFREAVAADPSDVAILLETARLCHAIGETDLALAYARGAIGESTAPADRRAGFDAVRRMLRVRGDEEGCRALLMEELARDPEAVAAHLELADSLALRGDYAEAAVQARAAATLLAREHATRSLTVHAWAHHMQPADQATATEYAKELELSGRTRAAVAILANAAQYNQDPDPRRRAQLAAAQQAEASGRHDLASELLIDAFDAEPHFDLIHTPLDEDLGAGTNVAQHVAVLENLSVACAPEQRAHWLLRTAQRLLSLPDEHREGCLCLYAAALADPEASAALERLRQEARDPDSLAMLAHALRAGVAARLRAGRELDALPVLEELSSLAESRLNNPHLAHAAWTQFRRLDVANSHANAEVSRLAARIRALEQELQAARAALAEATPETRPDALRRLIAALPDLPDHWPETLELLAALLRLDPDAAAASAHAERIHALLADGVGLALWLEERADQVTDPAQRTTFLARLAGVHARRNDPRATALACSKLLAQHPTHALGIARLVRAARRLGDLEQLQHALSLAARAAPTDRERGRILATQMRHYEQAGDYDACLSCAQAALHADPEAVDAAIVTMRHSMRLLPAVALPILSRARKLLGDSRPLLELECRAAEAAGDLTQLRQLTAHWSELLPSDLAPRLLELGASLGSGDVGALEQAAEAVLALGPTPDAVQLCQLASTRLGQLGEARAATRLTLRLLDVEGRPELAEAERCTELARDAGDAWLYTQALERLSARTRGEPRQKVLVQLADHHARLGDPTGESRALMRALAIDSQDRATLDRLVGVLAAAGDTERLVAVLNLRLEATPEREERRELLLNLATVSARWQHDPQQAEYYVRTVIAENPDDAAAIRQALGALFRWTPRDQALSQCFQIADDSPATIGGGIYLWVTASVEQRFGDAGAALQIAASAARRYPGVGELLLAVERLSLARLDVKTALDTYERLMEVAVGPHGRRALHYRAGRWLERAELPERALGHYVEAFRLAPGAGVAFRAIERVAEATHNLAPLVDTYVELADQLHDVRLRLDLLGKAASLCSNGLNQPARAVDFLLQADALSDDDRFVAPLLSAVTSLRSGDPAVVDRVLETIASQWKDQAEQHWNTSAKVRGLLRLARFEWEERSDPGAALAAVELAEQAAAKEEVEAGLLAELHAMRDGPARSLAPVTPSGRPVATAASRDATPPPALAPAVAPLPPTRLTAAPPARATPTPLPSPRVTPMPSVAAATASAAPAGLAADEAELRSRAAVGDAAALVTLAERLRQDPLRRAEASHMYTRALLAEPWRSSALEGLHALSLELGARATAAVTAELLSCFSPGLARPAHGLLHRDLWQAEDLNAVLRVSDGAPTERLLALIWEHAKTLTRYRRSLKDFGVSEKDQLSPELGVELVDAYTHALRTLGLNGISLFLHDNPDSTVRAVPTHPAVVVAPREPTQDAAELRFRLGQSLYLAQPHTVLLGALSEHDATELVEGFLAAFGPAERATPSSAATMQVAAQLWESVPARAQTELGELLHSASTPLSADALRRAIVLGGVRAGLYVCSDARSALLATVADAGLAAPTTRADFEAALRSSRACAEVLRTALSETYLASLDQVCE